MRILSKAVYTNRLQWQINIYITILQWALKYHGNPRCKAKIRVKFLPAFAIDRNVTTLLTNIALLLGLQPFTPIPLVSSTLFPESVVTESRSSDGDGLDTSFPLLLHESNWKENNLLVMYTNCHRRNKAPQECLSALCHA